MKKTLNLFNTILIGILFISCSSNDISNDSIIGVWKLTKSVKVYYGGTETTTDQSICEQKSRYTFKPNGEFGIISYGENGKGECIENPYDSNFDSGAWEKIEKEKYKIISTYFYSETKVYDTDTNIPDKIIFPSKNIMRTLFYDNDQYVEGTVEYSYDEFERIE